jgi:hypothetical protein
LAEMRFDQFHSFYWNVLLLNRFDFNFRYWVETPQIIPLPGMK